MHPSAAIFKRRGEALDRQAADMILRPCLFHVLPALPVDIGVHP